jgi:hypothetical protein
VTVGVCYRLVRGNVGKERGLPSPPLVREEKRYKAGGRTPCCQMSEPFSLACFSFFLRPSILPYCWLARLFSLQLIKSGKKRNLTVNINIVPDEEVLAYESFSFVCDRYSVARGTLACCTWRPGLACLPAWGHSQRTD